MEEGNLTSASKPSTNSGRTVSNKALMLLIYTPQSTLRLQYICKYIFEQLGLSYSITQHTHGFVDYDGVRINYSGENIPDCFTIKPSGLLQAKSVLPVDVDYAATENLPVLFHQQGGDLPFDIFSASFYLVSRYEEYLSYEPDAYDRFPFRDSIAYKNGFLNRPLVDEWVIWFGKKLSERYRNVKIKIPELTVLPTYDIDMAWSYRNKGLLRNIGGMITRPGLERMAVLTGLKKDPFDCYEFLNNLHEKNNLNPLYFFLIAEKSGVYDKNISPGNASFQKLIKEHARKYEIGLHPSWQSHDDAEILKNEKITLENIASVSVQRSRQHYIRMKLPETYERLLQAGIKDDYSMGYGSVNGFRAAVNRSFPWYNLAKEKIESLIIHPFCFMDANSHYEQKQAIEESKEEIMYYLKICKAVGGKMITVFHNSFLGSGSEFSGWKSLYTDFIRSAV
jgi:hypothetical protein